MTLPETHTSPMHGWKFDNSYATLPEHFYSKLPPLPVRAPKLAVFNERLAQELGLDLSHQGEDDLAALFAGNALPEGAEPLAQAYAGHQFGHFTMLGDGRAHLMGEHITPEGARVDIQYKGSGKTPYARRGDGRAALGPMLREYIVSEAMHALGIPTTRSLAVVTTGEPVLRETEQQGAILTRIAASHIRIGTFEFIAAQKDTDGLKQLADYVIARHYPDLADAEQPYLALIEAVMERQITLVNHWLRVGFIHGVMNTDNVALSGETIDYGPCAFMDRYDPNTVFSSIDRMGRYAYANQPTITQWNLARFAEAILPLLHDDIEQAAQRAEETLATFNDRFQTAWLAMMRVKLGLLDSTPEDGVLIGDLLKWMQYHAVDFTNTFRDLSQATLPDKEVYEAEDVAAWLVRWQERLNKQSASPEEARTAMQAQNPFIIPRNHRVEQALQAAETESDFSVMHALLTALKSPYQDTPDFIQYTHPPTPEERVYQTFCGT